MLHVDTIAEVRAACERARRSGATVGVVPTMGYLHEGHRSLMRAARARTDFVVVTIFVNPLQFGAEEDLDRYPRDLAGDLSQCADEGVDCVFTPSQAEMYPRAPVTAVHVSELTDGMCGAARPTHFDGVTTVVAKLFAIVGPSVAFFGRKDAQQLAVVTRMADDLNLPVEVVGCPLVREPDGLALSSRNVHLHGPDRDRALALSSALRAAERAAAGGERDPRAIRAAALRAMEPFSVEPEYLELVSPDTLVPVETVDGDVLVAVAARVGATRLIDNTLIHANGRP